MANRIVYLIQEFFPKGMKRKIMHLLIYQFELDRVL